MKSLLKYITLLLVGGVIIPFCLNMLPKKQAALTLKTPVANTTVAFSFIDDVVAKIWPVAKFFH